MIERCGRVAQLPMPMQAAVLIDKRPQPRPGRRRRARAAGREKRRRQAYIKCDCGPGVWITIDGDVGNIFEHLRGNARRHCLPPWYIEDAAEATTAAAPPVLKK